jgi:glycosyltransferase involved in cell wall biosynthesis
MKIGIVTTGFDAQHPGGVSNVVITLSERLSFLYRCEIDVINFSSERYNSNSVSFFKPSTYRNKRIVLGSAFRGRQIIEVGSFGAEFEILRYRNRRELTWLFNKFDLIIVVSGVLQFANVIPIVQPPVLFQVATRLSWERKSRYKKMHQIRRLILKIQYPVLALQERRVLQKNIIFLVENSAMLNWISPRIKTSSHLWYPGVRDSGYQVEKITAQKRNSYFVSVGRLDEARKGWERLLNAYKLAYDFNSKIPPLIIIGWGNLENSANQIMISMKEEYPIQILENLPDHIRDDYLVNASYYLQTSYEEGLGLAALEALSLGIPLICSETDGSREYVKDGLSGKLVAQTSNFIEDFAIELQNSKDWDYVALSLSSFALFNERFSITTSQSHLAEIIQTVQPNFRNFMQGN